MQTPNENGVYQPDITEELARDGRAYAALHLCQCEDGLYRYALTVSYSYGGFCGPVHAEAPGFVSVATAKEAALAELLRRFPRAWLRIPIHSGRVFRFEAGHRSDLMSATIPI